MLKTATHALAALAVAGTCGGAVLALESPATTRAGGFCVDASARVQRTIVDPVPLCAPARPALPPVRACVNQPNYALCVRVEVM